MPKLILFLVAWFAFGIAKSAEPAYEIKLGFLTGNSYLSLDEGEKRSYAIGIVDGIFLAPFFGSQKSKLRWIESCIVGMTDYQVAAIVEKFLRDNPGRWHEPMHALAYLALKDACGHQ